MCARVCSVCECVCVRYVRTCELSVCECVCGCACVLIVGVHVFVCMCAVIWRNVYLCDRVITCQRATFRFVTVSRSEQPNLEFDPFPVGG